MKAERHIVKKRVALIYGGISGEHSISCLTAASVMRAIDSNAYEVVPIAIAQDGTWVLGKTDPDDVEKHEVTVSDNKISLECGPNPGFHILHDDGTTTPLGHIDVAFPLVHGSFGEDGTLQGALEMMGIPYVGCGVFASAAGMDKHFMKIVLESAGLPVAPYVVADTRSWARRREAVLAEVEEKLTYPVYVKPARAGSSLGISRVAGPEALVEAVEVAHKVDPKVIIEQGIKGRELECAVLGGHGLDAPRTSVLGEIVLQAQWYDYDTKYKDTDGFHMSIPAVIPEEDSDTMRRMAAQLFEAFDCEGMTRADFFYTENREIYVNEHNTVPGFTSVSMYPILWDKTGIPYRELITELISLALERGVGLR